jgi:ligand-binding sensor domain-containing protein
LCTDAYRKLGFALLFAFLAAGASAQSLRTYRLAHEATETPPPVAGLASNSVTDIRFAGDTIWVATGSGLSRSIDDGETWESFDHRHGLGKGGVSALVVTDSIIWVATAFDTLTIDAGRLPAGGGLSYSTDRGRTWTHVPQPGPTPVQNVTYDIAILGKSIWITSWGGGLRRSQDGGKTWDVVPPDSFLFDPLGNLNHRAFSVIAVNGVLWVGTAKGVNRSLDSGRTWVNFNHQNQRHPISGNFVVALAAQRYRGRTRIWAATVETTSETGDTSEFRGVSWSDDDGLTWQTALRGVFAHNFAFQDSAVIVCADEGLFKSVDGGKTWFKYGEIYDATRDHRYLSTEFYGAAVDPRGRLWAGGADGLAMTPDNGNTWRIYRSFVPTGVGSSPRTYAYPNPFSPTRHNQMGGEGFVRFQYNTTRPTRVSLRIFDFAMELVATVVTGKERPVPGDYAEIWDGRNSRGEPVANGVYFYRLDIEGEGSFWGKLVVLD